MEWGGYESRVMGVSDRGGGVRKGIAYPHLGTSTTQDSDTGGTNSHLSPLGKGPHPTCETLSTWQTERTCDEGTSPDKTNQDWKKSCALLHLNPIPCPSHENPRKRQMTQKNPDQRRPSDRSLLHHHERQEE